MTVQTVNGTVVLHLPVEGAPIATGQDALDLLGDAWGSGAELVAVPASRLAASFFDLRSGHAGEFVQKLVNYRMRLAVLGDISAQVAASDALGAFVVESNRGAHVWFLDGPDELARRLAQTG
ncbi:DUF4180 domain-containing protein [Georgenia thermotolerans]|uniref:DUF4180 domain-containing protein n=1 Tax=Georgenia thermotolerans TaxID=527326 RepID=A0A7J5UND4_9MICO|nr:DUF4180 domain-containing protein [Georgenia thermotolerans]KAE8763751.1 DUF4180 domain-containing protein [Georgenia thermotolerans]